MNKAMLSNLLMLLSIVAFTGCDGKEEEETKVQTASRQLKGTWRYSSYKETWTYSDGRPPYTETGLPNYTWAIDAGKITYNTPSPLTESYALTEENGRIYFTAGGYKWELTEQTDRRFQRKREETTNGTKKEILQVLDKI
jgi:hypothetical protein